MGGNSSIELNNWGKLLIHKVVHPFTIFVTPLFVLVLTVYLIIYAFKTGISSGVRSFAGVLLPLIMVTFIFIFQRDLLQKLERIPTLISFSASFIVGIIVMVVIRLFAKNTPVPITELVLSGSFSILVFSYVSLEGNKMLSYYYGMISGLLFYIIFWGFPSLR
jgi:phosphoglycerol transferase MdoB-like AlkP superfamily enzyme